MNHENDILENLEYYWYDPNILGVQKRNWTTVKYGLTYRFNYIITKVEGVYVHG